MKKLKNILFKIIIIYMISYIFLANSISSYARVYDENCGKYVSDYARDFIEKYGGNSKYGDLKWEGGSFGQGTFWCVCTTGVAYMYEQALGIKISGKEIGFNIKAKANLSKYSSGFGGYGMEDSDKWDKIDPTESSMKPGDILIVSNGSYDSHAELYIGNGESANFGSGGANNCVVHKYNYTNWSAAFRLKGVDVTPNGNVPNASTSNTRERGSIYGSSGFIYQGTPESSGYSKSKTLGEFIVDSLKEILDWLIGIITYLFRAVIVGYASLFEHLIIDGLFDSLTGDGKVDETQINSDNSQTAQEQNVETETTTEPTTEEVTEKLENTASAAVKEKDAAEPKITVENIVFNRVPFLDANFFNFEKAGGEEIQPGSVIYLIRSNIAMWYYVFRVFGIALMLVILIYLGIKLAISSVAQDKAIYKKMLEAWVVGFLLLFLMHFIMILILQLNQSVIELITPKDENGVEYSLYLTVKTMAYEIKASTGWAGTIMYIVLIYYAIRFLYYYLRRLLHIFILVILSPIVAITSAIEKINKNGSSKGGIYGSWLKDYVLTVTQQAVHAIIYVIFIMTILKLVETSLLGIILSFVFLNFMLKAEKIFSKIFGYGEGTEFGKGILPNAVGIFAASKVAKRYKNYMQGVSKPIVKPAKKLGVTTFNAGIRMIDPVYQNTMGQEFKSIGKGLGKSKEKAYKKYEKARNKAIVSTIKNTGKALKTSALGVLVIPSFILDPQLGFVVAGKTAGNVISMNKSKRTITGATKESTRREFKLKGEYKSPQTQAKVLRQAINYLEKNGIDYRIKNNNIYVFDINNGEWKELHAYKKITRKRNGLAVDIINLLPGINIKEEAGLKNPNFVIATEEKIALLDEEGNVIEVNKNIKAGNIAKGVAKFYANANGLGLVGDVMTIAELTQLDLDDHTDKLEIYNKAIKTEDKIVRESAARVLTIVFGMGTGVTPGRIVTRKVSLLSFFPLTTQQ